MNADCVESHRKTKNRQISWKRQYYTGDDKIDERRGDKRLNWNNEWSNKKRSNMLPKDWNSGVVLPIHKSWDKRYQVFEEKYWHE